MEIIPVAVLDTNYAYVICHQQTCLVIDPGSAREVIDVIERRQLQLLGVLLTHKHMDHTAGLDELLAYQNVPVYGGATETFGLEVIPIQHQQSITLGAFEFKGIHLPGHTMGAVAYVFKQVVFTGDVLFGCGCGRIFEGNPEDMMVSLDRLRQLPDEMLVYFGHEYTAANIRFALEVEPNSQDIQQREAELSVPSVPSSIGLEKQTNPFMRIDESSIIEQVNQYVGSEIVDRSDRLYHLREWKNQFDKGGQV